MVDWVLENDDAIIVESRGTPTVAIIPFAEYENVEQARLQARRREALAKLERLRDEVSTRNSDLTEEQADELAGRIRHATVDRMVKAGRVQFKS